MNIKRVSASTLAAATTIWWSCSSAVFAADSVSGTVTVQCSGGKAGAQVAVRYGTPNYTSNSASPQLKLACPINGSMAKRSMPFIFTGPSSQLEIQTEGGIPTAYNLNVDLGSNVAGKRNGFQIDHSGSPTFAANNDGFTIIRSAGPNKYGEQNFRVYLAKKPAPSVHVHLEVKSGGDRSDTQVAMKWGHPDFNNTNDFGTWTLHPADGIQRKDFNLSAVKSEFEIQTEGGTGSGYDIKIWIGDFANYAMAMPSIVINHVRPTTDVGQEITDAQFSIPNGSIYGEMTVGIVTPWVTAPQPVVAATGGLNITYDLGLAQAGLPSSTTTTRFAGKWVAGSAPIVSNARTTILRDITTSVDSGFDNTARDQESGLQPGSWQVSAGLVQGLETSCVVTIGAGMAPFVVINAANQTCK